MFLHSVDIISLLLAKQATNKLVSIFIIRLYAVLL